GDEPVFLSASSLLGSPAFDDVVEEMQADPLRCARAYNEAVASHPESGLRPLVLDAGRVELPLWNLASGIHRERVHADSLKGIPRWRLAPRAILMTAMMRMRLCDLFIHGLGGGIYDRACDAWLAGWRPGQRLAPTAVVSATVRLTGLSDHVESSRRTSRRAVWMAHHARHNPGALGDRDLQARKMDLVRAVLASPARSVERRAAFDRLQEFVKSARGKYAGELDRLNADARALAGGDSADMIAQARDWPFFLYPRKDRAGLRGAIRDEFGLR
nr:hypothetical protein [Phycisphaerales bacterium]